MFDGKQQAVRSPLSRWCLAPSDYAPQLHSARTAPPARPVFGRRGCTLHMHAGCAHKGKTQTPLFRLASIDGHCVAITAATITAGLLFLPPPSRTLPRAPTMVVDAVRGLDRTNAARYDAATDVYVGPASQPLRIADIAAHPSFTEASPAPKYGHELTKEQHHVLAMRCSMDGLHAYVRKMMNDESLARSLRRRLLTWVDLANPGEGETIREKRKKRKVAKAEGSRRNSAEQGDVERGMGDEGEQGDEGGDLDTSRASSTDRSRGVSVAKGADDEADIQQRLALLESSLPESFRFQADPAFACAYYNRDTRLDESAIRKPVASAALKTPRPPSTSSGEYDVVRPTKVAPPLVVSIEVYARPTRGMWAKERYDFLTGRPPKRILKQDAGRGSESEDDPGDDGSDLPRRKKNTRQGPYGQLQLAQRIDVLSTSTLQELRDAFVCRMDDFPEMKSSASDDAALLSSSGRLATPAYNKKTDIPAFSGRKRATDSCFLIEGKLYGEGPASDSSYAVSLSNHFAQRATDKGKASAGHDSGRTMRQMRLDALELRTGELYWFLHQGSCEHVWAITSLRALRPGELGVPNTTLLPYGFVIRPLIRWARPKAKIESYALDSCEVCLTRHACMIVLGGANVQPHVYASGSGNSSSESMAPAASTTPSGAVHLPGLSQSNMSMCEVCWCTLTGAPIPALDEVMDRAGTNYTADMSGTPWAGAHGDGWAVVPALE